MSNMKRFSKCLRSLLVFTFIQVGCSSNDEASVNLGRGFGDNFDWKPFDDGLVEAKSSGKPLMLIIHKSWCGACKALKPEFAESSEIASLSKHFVMVNTEDDEEPQGSEFDIDGKYIPRIFFLDSNGAVQSDIYNENGNPSYKYYYSDPYSIADSMKKALESLMGRGIDNKIEL